MHFFLDFIYLEEIFFIQSNDVICHLVCSNLSQKRSQLLNQMFASVILLFQGKIKGDILSKQLLSSALML